MLLLTSLIWAIHNLNNNDSSSIQQPTLNTTTASLSTSDMNNTIIVHISQWKINDYGSVMTSVIVSIILIVSYIIEYKEFYNGHHNTDNSAHDDTTLLPVNFILFLYTQIYSVNTTSSPSSQYIGRHLSHICSTLAYTSLTLCKLIPHILSYIYSILTTYTINNAAYTSVYIMSAMECISVIILPRVVLVTSVGDMCNHLSLITYTNIYTGKVDNVSISNSCSGGDVKRRHLLAYILYLICLLCLVTTHLTHIIILTLSLLIACHFWYIISTLSTLERKPVASFYSPVQHDESTTSASNTSTSILPSQSTSDTSHTASLDIHIHPLYNYDEGRVKRRVCKQVYDTICTSILSLPTPDPTTTSKTVRENRHETNKQFNNVNKRTKCYSSNNNNSVYDFQLQVMIVTAVYLFIWGRFVYFATDHRHIISKLQVSYYPLIYCFLCIYTCMYCYCITYNI